MTALARQASGPRPASVRWRLLAWVGWRQHRAVLAAFLLLAGLTAIAMATTGFALHPAGWRVFSASPHSHWRLYDVTYTALQPVLLLLPVLAGVFIGAPLAGREIETGTARFAWVQGAGRSRQLVASALLIAALLAVVAIGLGLEFRWWLSPFRPGGWAWEADLFGLNPLPFAGWIVLGFSLGVFLGAAIRRTVPAMAATFACYALLWYPVVTSWRLHYLPPLRLAGGSPRFSNGGGHGYSMYWGGRGAPPDVLSTALGWPDGRLLSDAQLRHSAAWFRLHHIQIWVTYQPGSRLALFQVIEVGWLAALSVTLIAATVMLIRRRPA